MKKIILFFIAVCAIVSCDPTHEDISNAGSITVDELVKKTTVTVDKSDDGKNGNVISCSTSAPVNAKWTIGGKDFVGNSAWKKMKVNKDESGNYVDTEYTVVLTALCPDGTELTANFPVTCQVITNELQKIYLYGDPEKGQEPAVLKLDDTGNPVGSYGRFSDDEGNYFPTLSDDIYFGLKTLIIDIADVQPGEGCWGMGYGPALWRIMSGWWDGPYYDGEAPAVGLYELQITDQIAKDCAKGATAHDLDLMVTRGTVTIKSVYYEE